MVNLRILTRCELEVALTDKNINNVEDYCDAVFGSLYLFGPNVPQPEILTKKFGQAKFVIGEIAIVSTNYTNFSFLQSVSRIELFYSRFAPNSLERYVRIEDNANLTRLSWPNLKVCILFEGPTKDA
ncbi:hypothetical protein OESDEN_23289 [Oesophagostomum dentatum]|uniref:Receptor L-domain domain-containing protein n=1 Tax=Oesophagostomum dentatum TaxID=61180 RepID=A0A0B1RZL4_OESDE|nr:hypothetical protein OESDEN_23289 [Oesophagostomum dentatum]